MYKEQIQYYINSIIPDGLIINVKVLADKLLYGLAAYCEYTGTSRGSITYEICISRWIICNYEDMEVQALILHELGHILHDESSLNTSGNYSLAIEEYNAHMWAIRHSVRHNKVSMAIYLDEWIRRWYKREYQDVKSPLRRYKSAGKIYVDKYPIPLSEVRKKLKSCKISLKEGCISLYNTK
jgi:hypothetical protein